MKKFCLSRDVFEQVVACSAEELEQGGVVLLPTETVYGLMTLHNNNAGKEKIIELKNRPAEKHFQLLINSEQMLADLNIEPSETCQRLMKAFWPGGMTLIMPNKNGENVGVRYPDSEFMLAVIDQLGQPLAATSANLSGEVPVTNLEGIEDYFTIGKPDLVVDSGQLANIVSSSVILVEDEKVTVLREGTISKEQILNCVSAN